ncbi:MAG: DNA-binding domain-containing protein [Rhodobacteraceae bacterium]|nr:DNA-binding domain-containing protein [Paracoccaceae bacterium]
MFNPGEFVNALLDPNQKPPDNLIIRGQPAGRRFAVYRNNVVAGLSEVLATGFPVLAKLLGNEFFAAMATIYVRQHPPHSPILTHFGLLMPEFLTSFPPVQKYPYLPDVARLELALRRSCHAADSKPMGSDILAAMSEHEIENARIELAPAVIQLRSAYPIHNIYMANMQNRELVHTSSEDVLILRRQFDPEPLRHDSGGFCFIDSIERNLSLAAATAAARAVEPQFDLTKMLSLLLSHNAIVGLHRSNTAHDDG